MTIHEVCFQTIPQLVKSWPRVQSIFSQKGFVILTPNNTDLATALKVSRLFGPIQGHVRSQNGAVDIRSQSIGMTKQVVSDIAFSAHSDGSYLEGIAQKNGLIYRVGAPKMVALQCVQPAITGGVSFLVDGQRVLVDMIKNHPQMATTLASSGMITVCRDHHLISDSPVLRKLPSGLYGFRFSYDRDLYASSDVMKVLTSFNRHYIQNYAYITYLSLKERQILVFDNHRHLHGRTTIEEGERLLRRIWIQDELLSTPVRSPQKQLYFGSQEKSAAAFERFQPYLAAQLSFRSPKVESIPTGIRLSGEEENVLSGRT